MIREASVGGGTLRFNAVSHVLYIFSVLKQSLHLISGAVLFFWRAKYRPTHL